MTPRDALHGLIPPAPERKAAESRAFVRDAPTTAHQARADETTRVARASLEAEAASRQAKAARLRAARLEREATTPAPPKGTP